MLGIWIIWKAAAATLSITTKRNWNDVFVRTQPSV
jgi:hypothetical protein